LRRPIQTSLFKPTWRDRIRRIGRWLAIPPRRLILAAMLGLGILLAFHRYVDRVFAITAAIRVEVPLAVMCLTFGGAIAQSLQQRGFTTSSEARVLACLYPLACANVGAVVVTVYVSRMLNP
jgi:hypothetical protein